MVPLHPGILWRHHASQLLASRDSSRRIPAVWVTKAGRPFLRGRGAPGGLTPTGQPVRCCCTPAVSVSVHPSGTPTTSAHVCAMCNE